MYNLQGLVFLAVLENSEPQKHMSMGDYKLERAFNVPVR